MLRLLRQWQQERTPRDASKFKHYSLEIAIFLRNACVLLNRIAHSNMALVVDLNGFVQSLDVHPHPLHRRNAFKQILGNRIQCVVCNIQSVPVFCFFNKDATEQNFVLSKFNNANNDAIKGVVIVLPRVLTNGDFRRNDAEHPFAAFYPDERAQLARCLRNVKADENVKIA